MQKIIVISGLPGSGKSTISEGLSKKLHLPIFSIDPIEAAMWRSGISKESTGVAAYEVAATLAAEQLKLDHSVIIDAVSPIEAARNTWRKIADSSHALLIIIEVICGDENLHRQRIESRVRNIDGMDEIPWSRVLERKQEFEPWKERHLTLDSVDEPDALIEKALTYIASA